VGGQPMTAVAVAGLDLEFTECVRVRIALVSRSLPQFSGRSSTRGAPRIGCSSVTPEPSTCSPRLLRSAPGQFVRDLCTVTPKSRLDRRDPKGNGRDR
jgi:hypothetical protein